MVALHGNTSIAITSVSSLLSAKRGHLGSSPPSELPVFAKFVQKRTSISRLAGLRELGHRLMTEDEQMQLEDLLPHGEALNAARLELAAHQEQFERLLCCRATETFKL